jgi:single-strand DNA-binding protein
MNLVILIGNIGQDVELTSFENGGQIARTTLATNESYTNREGQKVDVTEWHNLDVSNKLADVFQKHVKKGDKIRVSGKLKTQSYDKEGVKHYITKVLVNEVEFLTPKASQPTTAGDNEEN